MNEVEKKIRKLLDDDMYGDNSRKRVVDGFLSLIQEERQGAESQVIEILEGLLNAKIQAVIDSLTDGGKHE